jgi:hypothetical protein
MEKIVVNQNERIKTLTEISYKTGAGLLHHMAVRPCIFRFLFSSPNTTLYLDRFKGARSPKGDKAMKGRVSAYNILKAI